MQPHRLGPPVYQWAADILRRRIAAGAYGSNGILPAERGLAAELKISRDSLRSAMAMLRAEGLIDCRRGLRARIRSRPDRVPVAVLPGQTVIARMPTPEERTLHAIPDGVPVLEVADVVYPAHRYVATGWPATDIK